MNDNSFFDTNVLVYLYSDDEPTKQQQALTQVENAENRWVSTQVINELSNTLRKKFKLDYADIEKVIAEIKLGFQIYPVQIETIERALKIAQSYRYSYYDSLIIATALELSCSVLYSEDMQDGQVIEKKLTISNSFITV